ncbi:MAG: hypothetical protein FWG55_04720, partial [Candidatus Bathyarchaeota archaeon]|nr:hypothetical protein [Candidatus Termiticorpusculum sp.]
IVHAVTSVSAQAGYKPSAPQFTVKLIDNSYDVPPSTTTTVDQYTGKETTAITPRLPRGSKVDRGYNKKSAFHTIHW